MGFASQENEELTSDVDQGLTEDSFVNPAVSFSSFSELFRRRAGCGTVRAAFWLF
jgi:hypothetical protein